MKQDLRIIRIEESKESQRKGPVTIFNKIIEGNISKLKRCPWITKKPTELQYSGPDWKFPLSHKNQAQNAQNKERKAVRKIKLK